MPEQHPLGVWNVYNIKTVLLNLGATLGLQGLHEGALAMPLCSHYPAACLRDWMHLTRC